MLRQFLFELPKTYDFNFSADTRRAIRKAILVSLSCDGNYLDRFVGPGATSGPDSFDLDLDLFAPSYHSHSPCARIFRKGEPIYRCLTCGFDETCALCFHCFSPDAHPGHNIHITICQRENGGVCDCSDPEAWVRSFDCPAAELLRAHDAARPNLDCPLPPALANAFSSTIETLLDYVIDVMSQSDLQFDDDADVRYAAENCTLDPQIYQSSSQDINNGKYFLMAYNDQVRHFRDAVQRVHLASKKVPQFAEMVTREIQSYGKAKVISSSDISGLKARQAILSATGIASCIRSHRDVFREDSCDEILKFLMALTDSLIFKTNSHAKSLFCQAFCRRWVKGLEAPHVLELSFRGSLVGEFQIPKVPSFNTTNAKSPHWSFTPSRWKLLEELCQSCNYNLSEDDYTSLSHHGSRFQYLVFLDLRFWKSIRATVHDIYSMSLITNLDYKNVFSAQYVDIYPVIADMFLLMDREPELNIMLTLSTQLFTCPSNSTSIVQHGDILRIFAAIYGFLSVGKIESPDTLTVTHSICMSSLKSRRWGQIFFDIGYILSRSRNTDGIFSDNIVPMSCDILALFQGRPVLKRESQNHIEYENPDYTAFFHAILVIYQFADHVSQCLNNISDKPYLRHLLAHQEVSYVVQLLLQLEQNLYPGLEDDTVDIELGEHSSITEPLTGISIDKFSVALGKVSFLHPLHSFLSWLVECFAADDFLSILNHVVDDKQLTSIVEYPLRTIVLMSQTKSGFWVRNGFSVRTQLQLYKNTGLREAGYLRDLFLVQVCVHLLNPDLMCFLMLERWLLGSGFSSTESSDYDAATLPYMAEECMSFMIHLVTENGLLKRESSDVINYKRMQNEIIHNLCFGPMNYTKLCTNIPDHVTAEKKFDIILESMTNFEGPTGPKDVGIYRLKEEYLDKVDPYYFNYNTNTKEDAIKFVKDRVHRRTLQRKSDIVITPKLTSVSVFQNVANFSTSVYFADFVVKTLRYVSLHGGDTLLETTLHLLHICAYETSIDPKYGLFYEKFVLDRNGGSIASLLYDFLSSDPFKEHHAKIRAIFAVFASKYDINGDLGQLIADFSAVRLEQHLGEGHCESESDRKKRIAKERQAKLMAKFKKQQSLFISNNMADAPSDEEMEDLDEGTGWKFPEPHCILCQNASEELGPFGIIAHVSRTSVLRNVPFDDPYWVIKAFSDSANLDEASSEPKTKRWSDYMEKIRRNNVTGPGFTAQDLVDSKLVSQTCGHGMHFQCYMNFLRSNRSRQGQITRHTPENADHNEFLCPLCKALNNNFIPVLWTKNSKSLQRMLQPSGLGLQPFEVDAKTFHDPEIFDKFAKSANADIQEANIISPLAKEMIGFTSQGDATVNQRFFRMLLSNMFQTLSLLTFPQIFKADSVSILSTGIKATEISLRGMSADSQFVVSQLSNNSLINLRTLNEFRNTILFLKVTNWIQLADPKTDAPVKLVAGLLVLSRENFNKSILYRDFFDTLVATVPLPRAGFSFNTILHCCFVGHVIQSLDLLFREVQKGSFDGEEYGLEDIPCCVDAETGAVSGRIDEVFNVWAAGFGNTSARIDRPPGQYHYSLLVKACTPFLRRAAIYAFVCCADTDGVNFNYTQPLEADRLCAVMNLPLLAEILARFLENTFEGERFMNFVSSTKPKGEEVQRALEYPGVVRLIDLPERLDYFFTLYYYSDKVSDTVEDPAVCLFCGTVVDVQKPAVGCKQGQCTTHFLTECANEVGLFLLPKDRTFLLLHKNGGSFHHAPYLDPHGELSTEAKKGKPLYLLHPRYDEFTRKIWLENNVANFIVRKLDSVVDAGGWDTL